MFLTPRSLPTPNVEEITIQTRHLPLLVLIGGAPASGKSTLADRLALDLGLPLLSKDLMKESLFETLGAPDRLRSRELSRASFALLRVVTARLIVAGVSVIIEANFQRGTSEAELGNLVAQSRAVLIHCQTTLDEITRRYAQRATAGGRHPGHFDAQLGPRDLAHFASAVYEPIELATPTLRVDTTNGLTPTFEEVRAFVVHHRDGLATASLIG